MEGHASHLKVFRKLSLHGLPKFGLLQFLSILSDSIGDDAHHEPPQLQRTNSADKIHLREQSRSAVYDIKPQEEIFRTWSCDTELR